MLGLEGDLNTSSLKKHTHFKYNLSFLLYLQMSEGEIF